MAGAPFANPLQKFDLSGTRSCTVLASRRLSGAGIACQEQACHCAWQHVFWTWDLSLHPTKTNWKSA